eukprot:jgi/Tetstr1/456874/TSEL_043546.t1
MRTCARQLLLLLVLAPTPVLGSAAAVTGGLAGAAFGRFLWLSDLHLDPLYGQPGAYGGRACERGAPACGRYGCDSPRHLVEIALAEAAAAAPRADFALVTGDFVRHKVSELPDEQGAFEAALRGTAELLVGALGAGRVVPVLGNNDLLPANHLEVTSEVPPGPGMPRQPALAALAELWASHGLLAAPNEVDTFGHGGYFARRVGPRLWLLALNTVVYSSAATPPSNATDPFGQWAWAREQLLAVRAACGAAIIAGHNPPSLATYQPGELSWTAPATASYRSLLAGFGDVLAGQCFGHTHAGEARAPAEVGAAGAPLLSQGSVVPTGKDGADFSNPTFSVVAYAAQPPPRPAVAIVDTAVWAADLGGARRGGCARWTPLLPSLRAALVLPGLSNADVAALGAAMPTDDARWRAYRRWYKAGVPQVACEGGCRAAQACLVRFPLSAEQFAACVDDGPPRAYNSAFGQRP